MKIFFSKAEHIFSSGENKGGTTGYYSGTAGEHLDYYCLKIHFF